MTELLDLWSQFAQLNATVLGLAVGFGAVRFVVRVVIGVLRG